LRGLPVRPLPIPARSPQFPFPRIFRITSGHS